MVINYGISLNKCSCNLWCLFPGAVVSNILRKSYVLEYLFNKKQLSEMFYKTEATTGYVL